MVKISKISSIRFASRSELYRVSESTDYRRAEATYMHEVRLARLGMLRANAKNEGEMES